MKVGVIGSGVVGQTLAAGFAKHGYEVMIGSQHHEKLNEWKEKNSKINVGDFNEVAEFGELIVLSVKGTAVLDILKLIKEKLNDKIVIDTTNPIANAPPENGVLKFFTTLDISLMEQLQEEAPKAKFVKAFNSVGNAHMINPEFTDGKPTMFICGNDEDAKKKVIEIVEAFGFLPEDMGKAEAARAIEPLCMLWCIPGFLRNEWNHAFKLLKK